MMSVSAAITWNLSLIHHCRTYAPRVRIQQSIFATSQAEIRLARHMDVTPHTGHGISTERIHKYEEACQLFTRATEVSCLPSIIHPLSDPASRLPILLASSRCAMQHDPTSVTYARGKAASALLHGDIRGAGGNLCIIHTSLTPTSPFRQAV